MTVSVRRIAVIEVAPVILIDMLTGHEMERLETNMPADAAVEWVAWDHDRRVLRLYVQSSAFDEVPAGQTVPPFWLTATRHTDIASELVNLVRRSEAT